MIEKDNVKSVQKEYKSKYCKSEDGGRRKGLGEKEMKHLECKIVRMSMGEMSVGEEAANYPEELLAPSSLFPLRDIILPC